MTVSLCLPNAFITLFFPFFVITLLTRSHDTCTLLVNLYQDMGYSDFPFLTRHETSMVT